MKKTLLFALLAILCLSVKAQDNQKSASNTFKGIKLGDTITSVAYKLTPLEANGKKDKDGLLHYNIKDEKFQGIGDNIKLNSALLTVFDGHIMSITILFDQKYGKDILDVFEKAYGDYYAPNRFLDQYFWLERVTDVSIDFDKTTQLCNAQFTSEYVSALNQVYKRDSAEKAKSDL